MVDEVDHHKSSGFIRSLQASMEKEADTLEDMKRRIAPLHYNRKKRKMRVLGEKKIATMAFHKELEM